MLSQRQNSRALRGRRWAGRGEARSRERVKFIKNHSVLCAQKIRQMRGNYENCSLPVCDAVNEDKQLTKIVEEMFASCVLYLEERRSRFPEKIVTIYQPDSLTFQKTLFFTVTIVRTSSFRERKMILNFSILLKKLILHGEIGV
jgi:hypothetical protein